MTPEISVVIPAYNEAESIADVVQRTADALRTLGRTFEVIVVNDGSDDDTSNQIQLAARTVVECHELSLSEHVGQGDALLAGFAATRGPWIVTLDGDGQNDPADIPLVLRPVIDGSVDMMCGWRQDRRDSWLRRVMSKTANAIRRRMLRDEVHDAGCQLRAFRRPVMAAFRPMELVQSFLPALAVSAGFRVGEVPVRHHARRHGRSKYGLARLSWRPAVAMLKLRRNLRVEAPPR
jgi:glycosyltransferase involved in cell wall biosynthesis